MKSSEIELNLPAGFRFHPNDDELVNHYLIKKCASKSLPAPIITEIDLYKFDPWELPELALYGEKEWYFFSPRDRKYPNGSRPNRAAGTGYWKATGADKPIGCPALGIKKALVFYAGKAPGGIKTNWIMHEYRLANVDRSARNKKNSRLDDWVLCRIYNKKGIMEKHVLNHRKNNHMKNVNMYEDKKTDVVFLPGFDFNQQLQQKPDIWTPMKIEEHALSDITDSIPKLESSSSEHAVSPDSQVQSEPKWDELELDKDFDFEFNGLFNDPFESNHFQFQIEQFSALHQFPQ